jgi:carboxymethylenebutenolidase
VPVLLHIAANDQLCPPPAQQEIARALGDMPNVKIQTYADVGHAFARRRSAAYVEAAVKRIR